MVPDDPQAALIEGLSDREFGELLAPSEPRGAAPDPLEAALEATVGRLRTGGILEVRDALAALARRLDGASSLDRCAARTAAAGRLAGMGVVGAWQLCTAAFAAPPPSRNGQHPAPGGGRVSGPSDPEPWPEPVDGAELLRAMAAFLARFVVLPPGAADTLAAFALSTHAIECFHAAPYVALESPTPRCGKSRTLEILALLVRRPWYTTLPTTAVLFRKLERDHPTALLDECQLVRDPASVQDLRDLLNAGYRRGTAVTRCVGDTYELRDFDTFGPKVFALIGAIPGALGDRCIHIPMRRRRQDERVEEYEPDRVDPEGVVLARQARRWVEDHRAALGAAAPVVPESLNDRLREIWRPLLVVAEVAGGGWHARLVAAARVLQGPEDALGAGETLLADLYTLFRERAADQLPTAIILEALHAMPERPWPEWSHGKPLSARGLAKLLAPFGVAPEKWRDGHTNVRGYSREQFADAWSRYPAVADGAAVADAADVADVADGAGVSATRNSLQDLAVADVADVADTSGVSQIPPRSAVSSPPPAWGEGRLPPTLEAYVEELVKGRPDLSPAQLLDAIPGGDRIRARRALEAALEARGRAISGARPR